METRPGVPYFVSWPVSFLGGSAGTQAVMLIDYEDGHRERREGKVFCGRLTK